MHKMPTPPPPNLPGYTVRLVHACDRCGDVVRVEYRLKPGVTRPASNNLFYWEWRECETPGGLVILSCKHLPAPNAWQPLPTDACGFGLLAFETGARSAIDQFYALVSGQVAVAGAVPDTSQGLHVRSFSVERLLDGPLACRASEIQGRARPLVLLASAAMVRWYFDHHNQLAEDANQARDYHWQKAAEAGQGLLELIEADVEPVRG